MNRQFYKNLTFLGWVRIIYLGVAALAVIYFWLNPLPKYEKDFINEKYHYKIVKQFGFTLTEGQPLEKIVFERSIKRRRYYLLCEGIYYGVEIHPWSKELGCPIPESEEDLLDVSDILIDNIKDSIIEVREKEIVNVKPNHKGIETSLIIKDSDTGKPFYYYETRIWAYGNMYLVHLNADIETINTKERRAERDKDYRHTFKEIMDSFCVDENIKSAEPKQDV